MINTLQPFNRMSNHFLKPRWFIVALVVGTILNLINQGSAILNGQSVNTAQLLLTYTVPYWVSSLSAWFDQK